jgi:hypothetical protein
MTHGSMLISAPFINRHPPPSTTSQYLAEVDPGRQRLLDDVKTNTMRYVGIVSEAADEAMPPPEGLPQADIFDRLLESVSLVGEGGGKTSTVVMFQLLSVSAVTDSHLTTWLPPPCNLTACRADGARGGAGHVWPRGHGEPTHSALGADGVGL